MGYTRDFIYALAETSEYNSFYKLEISPHLDNTSIASFMLKAKYYDFTKAPLASINDIEGMQKIKDFVEPLKMFVTVLTTNDSTIHMGIASSAESVILRDRPKGISMLLHSAISFVMKENRKFMFTAPANCMAEILKKNFKF